MSDETNKVIPLNQYFDRVMDRYDDQHDDEVKSFDFSRDGGGGGAVGGVWDEEVKAWADMLTLESLFYSEDWVFITVDVMANKLSSQPLYVMQRSLVDGVESIDYADGHPLNALIENPNPLQDYHSWMYNTVVQYGLLGNSVTWYSKANNWLTTLRTAITTIDFNNDGSIKAYSYAAGEEGAGGKAMTKYQPKEIIHVRRPNPASLLWGLSPFIPGRKSILFNRYSTDYLNAFYLKQATPGMILEMDREINEQQALRQLRSLELAYTGRKNQRRTMLLPKGVKATMASHTMADQKILDLVNTNRETILNLLRVPKHELGLQTAGSLGSEEYKISLRNFWESTLIPTSRLIEGALNKFFAKQLGPNFFFQFDLSGVEALKDDQMKKATLAKEMLAGGLSVNEVRTAVWDQEAAVGILNDVPFVSKPQGPVAAPTTAPEAVDPAAPIDPNAPATTEVTQEVAAQASTTPQQSLNGAQVASLVDVVNQVAQGLIPRETGVEILRVAFALSKEDAEAIMGAVGQAFTPDVPVEPTPAQEGKAELVAPDNMVIDVATTEVVESGTAKLMATIESRKAGWTEGYIKDITEIVDEKEGKKLYDAALETLVAMAEAAAPIIKAGLRETKADLPSKTRLKKEIAKALNEFESTWVDQYVETLISTVDTGYGQQVSFVFNEQDKEKIEALKSRDEKKRLEILTERGLDSFASISKTTTDGIMKSIAEGVERNETIQQITARVAEKIGNVENIASRAATIARTETLTAVSIGQQAAISNASEVIPGLRKAWLNANDARVRDAHLDTSKGGVSGEVVDANEKFSNGLRGPRDVTSEEAGEVINCRCVAVMLLPGESL